MEPSSGPTFPQSLALPAEHRRAMLAHVRACLPEEGCGLLGGLLQEDAALVTAVIPVPNELRSPVRFRMDPSRQIEAFFWLERQGLELVGIFHSHPAGPPAPSQSDVDEFMYPGVLSLIWSPLEPSGEWQVRAFRIQEGQSAEVPLLPSASSKHGPSGPHLNPR